MQEVKELVGIVNKALPGAWEAAVRQMYLNGIMFMIIAMASGIGAGVLWVRMRSLPEDKISAESIIATFGLACVCVLMLILGLFYLINPEYWAIDALKSM